MDELNIKIGGAAGQGLQSAGFLLGKSFVRAGHFVFAIQDAMSRIRGGHNFFQLRVGDRPVAAMTARPDIVVALDDLSVEQHESELLPGGVLIHDAQETERATDRSNRLHIPFRKLAVETGGKSVFANSVALGAVFGLLDFDLKIAKKLLRELFVKDGVAQPNIKALDAGFAYARDRRPSGFKKRIPTIEAPRRIFITGNEAIALGAIAADCRFMSAYPMSPSTSIITYLAGQEAYAEIVTEQAEDEIAAINMAFGASLAGVRAMTATSGGGLALMTETLSLLGVSEVPLVIVDCQRPGPATGLPTRTEQSDLLFVIHAGHGEFARVVLAPGNAEQAFYDTVRAFNLADRFQVPAFILSDQYLSESYFTLDPFDLGKVTYETSLLPADALEQAEVYLRYRNTETGVSPRAYPNQSDHIVITDSHEHDESGLIADDAATRVEMHQKRLRKIEHIRAINRGPESFVQGDCKRVIVGWGSTREILIETARKLSIEGENTAVIHFDEIWPFPQQAAKLLLKDKPKTVVVENNATGQLAKLLAAYTGHEEIEPLLRYDGRPFMVDELVEQIKGSF